MKLGPVISWMKWTVGAIVLIASAAGVFLWQRGDELLRDRIVEFCDEHLDGWTVGVGRVQLRGRNTIAIRDLSLVEDGSDEPLAEIPSVEVTIDPGELVDNQRIVVRQIEINRPVMRIVRDIDGRWDWQDLTRQIKRSSSPPELEINDATVELILNHAQHLPPARLVLQDGRISTNSVSGQHMAFRGSTVVPGAGTVQVRGGFSPASGAWNLQGSMRQLAVGDHLMTLATSTMPQLQQQLTQVASRFKTPPLRTAARSGPGTGTSDTSHDGFGFRSDSNGIPGLAIAGTLDVHFDIHGDATGSDPTYRLLVGLVNGHVAHPSLPFSLNDVSGKFFWDNNNAIFRQIVARNGATEIRVDDIRIDRRRPARPARIGIGITSLPLDERLRRVMPPSWRKPWDPINARGSIDVSGKLASDPNGRWRTEDVVVTVAGCSARHDLFSYPVENIAGEFRQRPGLPVYDVSLTGIAGRNVVALEGFLRNPGPEAESFLQVSANDVPLDSAFRNACDTRFPQGRAVLEKLALTGVADLRVSLHRPPGLNKKPLTTLAASLRDASMKFQNFPYPLNGLNGRVGYSGRNKVWVFEELKATHDDTELSARGSFNAQSKPGQLNLTVTATDGAFDRDLYSALGPELRQLWQMMRPDGLVDFTVALDWTAVSGTPVRASITDAVIRDGRMLMHCFPYELTDVQAALKYENGRASIRSFSGRHGRTVVNTRGYSTHEPDGRWRVHLDDLSATDVEPDADLRRALPDALRQGFARLNPTEAFSITDGEFDFHGNRHRAEDFTAAWKFDTRLSGGNLNAGLLLEDVHGRISSRGGWDGRRLDSTGDIRLASFNLLGHRLEQIHGPYRIDDDLLIVGTEKVFQSEDLSHVPRVERINASAYGGTLKLDARVRLRDPNPYQLYVTMDGALLEQYARVNMPDQKNLSGVMRGWIHLKGEGTSSDTATGRGQMQISPAALYELPVIVRVFEQLSSLSLVVPRKTAFDNAIANFTVDDGAFWFNPVDLVGNPISMRGQGVVRFDGRIAMDMYSRPPQRSRNFFNALVNESYRDWVAVRLRGTVDRPQARIHSGFVLDEAMRNFLTAFNPNPQGVPRLPFPNLIPPILGQPGTLWPARPPNAAQSPATDGERGGRRSR